MNRTGPAPGAVPFARDRRRILHDPEDRGRPLRHSDLSPVFLEWLVAERLEGKRVLDLGCGEGRLSFALAPFAETVVGLDREGEAVRRAGLRVDAEGVGNVRFAVADVEEVEYDDEAWGGRPDVVTAHLCLSDAMIERAGRALVPGGPFAFVCLHRNQWRETGIPSRFAYTEESLRLPLERAGFVIVHGRVEEEVLEFPSSTEAERILSDPDAAPRGWDLSGPRTQGLLDWVRRGGREVTRKSHLVVLARKASARGGHRTAAGYSRR